MIPLIDSFNRSLISKLTFFYIQNFVDFLLSILQSCSSLRSKAGESTSIPPAHDSSRHSKSKVWFIQIISFNNSSRSSFRSAPSVLWKIYKQIYYVEIIKLVIISLLILTGSKPPRRANSSCALKNLYVWKSMYKQRWGHPAPNTGYHKQIRLISVQDASEIVQASRSRNIP